MTRLLPLLVLSLATAEASAATRKICVRIDTDYDDSDLSGEDFFANNGLKSARGVQVRLTDLATNTHFTEWTDVDGADIGCATFVVPTGSGVSYRVTIDAKAQINGNKVRVLNSFSNTFRAEIVASSDPMTSDPPDYVLSGVDDTWSVIAAASRALHRTSAGLTGTVTDYYVEHNGIMYNLPASCAGSDCIDGSDIYVSSERAHLKFAVAYTMGWSLMHHMGMPSVSVTADDTHCGSAPAGSVRLNSLEYDAAAWVYGYAHYYASVTFNKANEADCTYNYWLATDWDQLSTCHKEKEAAASHVLSCAGKPGTQPLPGLIPDRDYRGYCDKRSPGATLDADTAVPFDVVRFFRDIVEHGHVTRHQVGMAMDHAVVDLTLTPGSADAHIKAGLSAQGMSTIAYEAETAEHGL